MFRPGLASVSVQSLVRLLSWNRADCSLIWRLDWGRIHMQVHSYLGAEYSIFIFWFGFEPANKSPEVLRIYSLPCAQKSLLAGTICDMGHWIWIVYMQARALPCCTVAPVLEFSLRDCLTKGSTSSCWLESWVSGEILLGLIGISLCP